MDQNVMPTAKRQNTPTIHAIKHLVKRSATKIGTEQSAQHFASPLLKITTTVTNKETRFATSTGMAVHAPHIANVKLGTTSRATKRTERRYVMNITGGSTAKYIATQRRMTTTHAKRVLVTRFAEQTGTDLKVTPSVEMAMCAERVTREVDW